MIGIKLFLRACPTVASRFLNKVIASTPLMSWFEIEGLLFGKIAPTSEAANLRAIEDKSEKKIWHRYRTNMVSGPPCCCILGYGAEMSVEEIGPNDTHLPAFIPATRRRRDSA